MRFFTVTLNPAFDRIAISESSFPIMPDDTVRVTVSCEKAGGKGINSARALTALGEDCTAVFLAGNEDAGKFSNMLDSDGLKYTKVTFDGKIRVNVTYKIRGGEFEINDAGDYVPDGEIAVKKVIEKLQLSDDDCVVIGGSLPKGNFKSAYSDIIAYVKSKGAKAVLDTSGDALGGALAGELLPDMIKPNRAEIEGIIGKSDSLDENFEKVKAFALQKNLAVIETLGKDGSFFTDGKISFYTPSIPLREEDIADMKGAGDVYLAAFLHVYFSRTYKNVKEAMIFANEAARKHLTGEKLIIFS